MSSYSQAPLTLNRRLYRVKSHWGVILEFCIPQPALWAPVIQSVPQTIFIYPIRKFPNFSWYHGISSIPKADKVPSAQSSK